MVLAVLEFFGILELGIVVYSYSYTQPKRKTNSRYDSFPAGPWLQVAATEKHF